MTEVNIDLLMNIRELVCDYDTRFRATMQPDAIHLIDVLMAEIYGVFSIVGGDFVPQLDPLDPRCVIAMAVHTRVWSWYNLPQRDVMDSLSPSDEDTIRDVVQIGPVRRTIHIPPALDLDSDDDEEDNDMIRQFALFVHPNATMIGVQERGWLMNLARMFYIIHEPVEHPLAILSYGEFQMGPMSQFEMEAGDPQFNSEMVRSESDVKLQGDEVEACSTDICAICKDPPEGKVRATACGHRFCSGCIEEWARYKTTCPVCRKSIGL